MPTPEDFDRQMSAMAAGHVIRCELYEKVIWNLECRLTYANEMLEQENLAHSRELEKVANMNRLLAAAKEEIHRMWKLNKRYKKKKAKARK